MSVTGPEDGEPVKVGQAIGDLTTGMFAAMGVLARLYERERVGENFVGKFDVGLFDSIVSLMNEYLTEYSMDGSVPGPQGTSHQTLVPYQRFETADGALVTGVPSDDRWGDFVELLGREELLEYPTNDDRQENEATVLEIIEAEFEKESTENWLDALTEYGFPCGPISDVRDVVEHEQTTARDLTIPHEDPDWGECLLPGHPIAFEGYEPEIREPAPRLGEHTEEVFEEIAGDQTTLEEWADGGAFGE